MFTLRKILHNNYGSGFGTLLVLIPFIVSTLLTVVYFPMGQTNEELGGIIQITPDGYGNMTVVERKEYLNDSYGGLREVKTKWGIGLTWYIVPICQQTWYIFGNGAKMTKSEYDRFVNGGGDDPDYLVIASSVILINPPALQKLGIYGDLFRVVLMVSVAIGLVEIIWIG